MRRLIIICIVLMISCMPAKKGSVARDQANSIVYILPSSVDSLLKPELVKQGKLASLVLAQDSSFYTIYVSTLIDKDPFFKKSNRCVFINGQFYKLCLSMDMVFATAASADEILEDYSKEPYLTIPRRYTINEEYFISFKRDGQIIDVGNGLTKPHE